MRGRIIETNCVLENTPPPLFGLDVVYKIGGRINGTLRYITNSIVIFYTDYKHLPTLSAHSPLPSAAANPSDFLEVSQHFQQLEHEVIDLLDKFPNALAKLKQVLATLVFPRGEGKVVPLIDPRSYENALTVQELFRRLIPHWNPLSPDLLGLLLETSGCSMAGTKIAEFVEARNSKGNLVLCVRQMPSSVDFRSVHSAPLSQLQSLHHSLFAQLSKHQATFSRNTIRISVEVDKDLVDLSDYERITTAVSGLYWMPKTTFIFAGCVEQPLVLSWLTIPEFLECTCDCVTDISGYRLLAETRVTGIAVGGWFYQCPTIKVYHSNSLANTWPQVYVHVLGILP